MGTHKKIGATMAGDLFANQGFLDCSKGKKSRFII